MPLVSVITRTKERPLMMKRAVESVCAQTSPDLEWVIVNDGGPPEPIEAVAATARQRGRPVRVLHNETSLGMEGASNRGLHASDSEFVVIHDDDDTWEPAFLARTTSYLRSLTPANATRGVVTRSTRVVEQIRDGRIVEKFRLPYDRGLTAITLFQMAHLTKVPPPISFLYRRKVFDTVGYYRDDLEVLGDWEFNLRFLSRFDIGVLPEALANYHWRTTARGDYGNTVVAGLDRHAAVAARLRNELLRNDLAEGRTGMGFIVNICHEFHSLENASLLAAIARRVLSLDTKFRLAKLLGL